MKINFMSSKDSGERQPMYSKEDKIEIMIVNTTNDIINELS